MRRYKRFVMLILILEIFCALLVGIMYKHNQKETGKIYKVEVGRVKEQLKQSLLSQKADGQINESADLDMSRVLQNLDLDRYDTIVDVKLFDGDEIYNGSYEVIEVDGQLYRVGYEIIDKDSFFVYLGIVWGMLFAISVVILIYIGKKMIRPFQDMETLTTELAKGNLSTPLKVEKSKYFARYLWGMDMLREHLEEEREKELKNIKEKKTLILSLSHDIKTPLSAILLYVKAMEQNLYDTEEKQEELRVGIRQNAKQIEQYVNEIVTASREDFLKMEVNNGEFYLWELVQKVQGYYRDKFEKLHSKLQVEDYTDCLLRGDIDRMVEIMQNIIENALKYGDGTGARIYFDREEDCQLIYVENTGCTLKEEELGNLFDSFYRGSNSTGIKGSGLGLYISKELIKRMDGDLFVELDGENQDIYRAGLVVRMG